MDRWKKKVAVITGAGSGIGAACAVDLIKSEMIVIGIGRRKSRVEAIKKSMPIELICNFHAIKCDVLVEKEVSDTFKWIVETFGGIDVLVNCAGIFREGLLVDKYKTKIYKDTLNTILMGTMFCTREAFASMKARNAPGHIFFITSSFVGESGSIANWEDNIVNIFAASVHGLKAMVETYRQEFREQGTSIKASDIRIGMVATEIWTDIKTFVVEYPFLEPTAISNAIVFALKTPPNVEITNLTIKPLGEKF